jgi:hypothetical protein
MPPATMDVPRLTIKRPRRYANSSTEEDFGESGESFLESRKAKRTGASAQPSRRTITTGTTGTATKPYDQAKRTSKSRRPESAAQSADDDDGSALSSDSSSFSSTSTYPRCSPAKSKSKSNNGSDSEATVVTTTSAIQTMNPGLSNVELPTAWREAGGWLFESIQELIDVKKMIYHGIGERLIERKRECGREYLSFFLTSFPLIPSVSFHDAQRSNPRL